MTLLISGWGEKWNIIYHFNPGEDAISDLTPIELIIDRSGVIVFMCKWNTDVVLVITTVGSSLLAVHLGYHPDPFKELSS
jgi:hypothetical protein